MSKALWVAVPAFLILLTACAPGNVPSAGAPQGQQQVSNEPKRGGYLRHLLPYSPQNLDPYTTEEPTGYGFIVRQWFEPLVSLEYKPGEDWRIGQKVIPWLAESWTKEGDRTYVFKLRKDAKFNTGDPMTAKDVVYSYSRLLDPNEKINPQVRLNAEPLESVTAVEEYTVRLVSKTADPDSLINLSDYRIPVMSSKFVESGGDITKQVVGTGPFKLNSYRKDAEGVAVRNEYYWQRGKPYLDGVKYTLKVDDSTMAAAVTAGQADILMRNDKTQFQPLQAANPKLKSDRAVVNQIYSININAGKAPLNDQRVRRAIFLALDRQELDKGLTFQEGTLSMPLVSAIRKDWSISPEEILKQPGYRTPHDQDVTEAKRLLAEAGQSSGFKTTIMYQTGFGFTPQASEAVQAQLKKYLNIEAELLPLENPAYTPKRTAGQFDMVVESASVVDRPASYARTYFHSAGIYSKGAGINDPEVDRLVEAQGTEFDSAKRSDLFKQLQKVLAEKAYTVPLPQATLYAIWQPWVHDWSDNRANRQTVMNPWQIWMDLNEAPADRKQP